MRTFFLRLLLILMVILFPISLVAMMLASALTRILYARKEPDPVFFFRTLAILFVVLATSSGLFLYLSISEEKRRESILAGVLASEDYCTWPAVDQCRVGKYFVTGPGREQPDNLILGLLAIRYPDQRVLYISESSCEGEKYLRVVDEGEAWYFCRLDHTAQVEIVADRLVDNARLFLESIQRINGVDEDEAMRIVFDLPPDDR